ncbi:MAG: DNA mismatch repair protein MutS [Anaerolineae bacterium]|nr:DNA mismatch repair protein MutS [Anaerolineae bacterium]
MSKVTPVRRQYLDIKKQFPDTLVFFRLGDFYETFDEDAEVVARELDIVLTSRNVSKSQRVPMAGVPHHAMESYVAKLIERGYHVAIADQTGPVPKSGLVKREVTRVMTPGTVAEPGMLDERRNSFIAALAPDIQPGDAGAWKRMGFAYADVTTGEFAVTQLDDPEALLQELTRLAPREVILPQHIAHATFPEGTFSTPLPGWHFDARAAERNLMEHFNVAGLQGFGIDGQPCAVQAAGALLGYLKETQRGALAQIRRLRAYSTKDFMALDAATRRNLELTETIRGGKARGSLLHVLDRTLTPMGARMLRAWVNQPLLDCDRLNARLDAVEVLYGDAARRAEIAAALKTVSDLERLTNRLLTGRAGPRGLAALRKSLEAVPKLRGLVEGAGALAVLTDHLDPCPDVAEHIAAAIADDPPARMDKVGAIRPGYSAELDDVADASRDARDWVTGLEKAERKRTGIKSLKVGFNQVHGYYIEVSKANTALVPADYERRQTLVNAERYITPELKEKEALILNAEEQILEIEARLFAELCQAVGAQAPRLLKTARGVAQLDVLTALAEVAAREGYTRPTLTEADTLVIKGGRHPVVEKYMPAGRRFVPNDVAFADDTRIQVITGPNMAGKSVALRQAALIVLMAQIGSFVPADEATIGLVDRIFTRIGAQDEVAAGQSTFMVEMIETALILNQATTRSLLILDEIGRGTSTYDGLSLAWAIVEYIHNHPRLKAKTLFATHYHELTTLEDLLPAVANYNMSVAEEGDSVVFLYKLARGSADRSYGIHVARLAGLPRVVTERADEIMEELERTTGRAVHTGREQVAQMALFPETSPLVAELSALDVAAMSPLEAINKLYEWQQRFGIRED